MSKPVIAIDIDDVLADSTELIRTEVNALAGVDLQPAHYAVPGEYWGYYEGVWRQHGIMDRVSFDDFETRLKAEALPHFGAATVLHRLAEIYQLIIITARNEKWKQATEVWLAEHFGGTPLQIYFAGNKEHATQKTKGEVAAELHAKWLIDDHVQHCVDAMAVGVTPLLFGSYGWQQGVPGGMVRCKDWQAVQEYFDGIS